MRAELPGIDPDRDVDISIVDGNLRIRAERRHEGRSRNATTGAPRSTTHHSPASFLCLPPRRNQTSGPPTKTHPRGPRDHQHSSPSKIPISRTGPAGGPLAAGIEGMAAAVHLPPFSASGRDQRRCASLATARPCDGQFSRGIIVVREPCRTRSASSRHCRGSPDVLRGRSCPPRSVRRPRSSSRRRLRLRSTQISRGITHALMRAHFIPVQLGRDVTVCVVVVY